MSRPSLRQAATPQASAIGVGLAIVLVVPRLMRFLYPEVWIEDDFYLENAYLVSVGMRPYLDFLHVHFPVLEWAAGLYVKLFGASLVSLGFLNEAVIYTTSLLVFGLARRAADRPVAFASAILYGFASLVFRYHVYERECLVAPLVAGATILVADESSSLSTGRAMTIAGLLALACAIKLTAVVSVVVLIGYLGGVRRRRGSAIAIGAAVVVAIALLSAFCYWRYGFEFVFQTFLFHFMKGRDTRAAIVLYPTLVLDILAPLFALGVIRMLAAGLAKGASGLVLALAAAQYFFFGLLSPTAWGHNYLEGLPFIAVIAGFGLLALYNAIRNLITAELAPRSDWIWAIGGGLLTLICLLIVTPLINENWLRDSVYGFGFVPREEISRIATSVQRATTPNDVVIAPSFICFEANRPQLIRYPEVYGAYREAKAVYQRYGFRIARQRLGSANFFSLIGDTAHYWTDPINDAVARRQVKIVISDSPIQLLPLVLVRPELLASNGYRPILRTEHYTVWELESAPTR
ncbi:MAG TPA: glycosyltransferase family 39 protein [Candidatus Binataceae bacterium]|nr:glycosyltransferase family 39 protein [Candidatus Binataceae bacterium]